MANDKLPPLNVPQAVCDEMNRAEKVVDDTMKGRPEITSTYITLVKQRAATGPAEQKVYDANPAFKTAMDARTTEMRKLMDQQDAFPKGGLSKKQLQDWDALGKKTTEASKAVDEGATAVTQALNKCRVPPMKP